MQPLSLSAWVALIVFVLTIVDHFLGVVVVGWVAMALLVLFVLLEVRHVPRSEVAAALVLVTGGLTAAWVGGKPGSIVGTAIHHTQPFFLLFASIAWLRVPAEISPSLRAAQALAVNQPSGRRFPVLLAAAHVLGAIINLAGVSLMVGVIHDAKTENMRRRVTCALTQGFTSASCWTPFFVAMSVGLSLVPGLVWSDVVPYGLAAAVLLAGLSWGMDRLFYSRADAAEDGRDGTGATDRFHWRMLVVPVSLFSAVIGMVEVFRFPIPVVLGLVAPAYALGWMIILTAGRVPPRLAVRDLAHRVAAGLPALRGEILLFLAANLFGTGIAVLLPPELVGRLLAGLSLPPDALIVGVLLGIVVPAFAGVHPLVPVLVIGTVMPPQALGLSPAVFCAAMVAMWGIGAVISPFSGTTLFMRRIGNLSAWRLAWLWNGPYGIAGTVLIGAAIIVTRHLGIA